MVMNNGSGDSEALAGKVGLAQAVQALREELTLAIAQAPSNGVRFGLGPVELTVEAAVTTSVGAKAGIKWWLIDAGAEGSREAVSTQTIHLTLNPIQVQGNSNTNEVKVVDVLIADTDEQSAPTAMKDPSAPSAEPE